MYDVVHHAESSKVSSFVQLFGKKSDPELGKSLRIISVFGNKMIEYIIRFYKHCKICKTLEQLATFFFNV